MPITRSVILFHIFPDLGLSLNDLFQTRRRFGGIARPPKPSEPPSEEEALGPETAAEEEEAPKDKAILKNPKWEVEKVGFNEETDISVEAQLPEAEAHKTKVAFGTSPRRRHQKEFHFREDCLGYIRAEDLKDIHRSWRR